MLKFTSSQIDGSVMLYLTYSFMVDSSLSSSSTQASPDKFGGVSSYSPCLFGKGIVVHARQTYIQQTKTFTKTKLSETITQIVNSSMLSFNPSVDPVVC